MLKRHIKSKIRGFFAALKKDNRRNNSNGKGEDAGVSPLRQQSAPSPVEMTSSGWWLVLGWGFDVVEDQDLDGAFFGLEF